MKKGIKKAMMACVLGGMMAASVGIISPQAASAEDVWAYTSGASQGYVETDDIRHFVDSGGYYRVTVKEVAPDGTRKYAQWFFKYVDEGWIVGMTTLGPVRDFMPLMDSYYGKAIFRVASRYF